MANLKDSLGRMSNISNKVSEIADMLSSPTTIQETLRSTSEDKDKCCDKIVEAIESLKLKYELGNESLKDEIINQNESVGNLRTSLNNNQTRLDRNTDQMEPIAVRSANSIVREVENSTYVSEKFSRNIQDELGDVSSPFVGNMPPTVSAANSTFTSSYSSPDISLDTNDLSQSFYRVADNINTMGNSIDDYHAYLAREFKENRTKDRLKDGSGVLAGAASQVFGGFDPAQAIFAGAINAELDFKTEMRKTAFQVEGITGDLRGMQSEFANIGNSMERAAGTEVDRTKFQELYGRALKKGYKKQKDTLDVVTTSLNLSNMLGADAEPTSQLFYEWYQHTNASANEMSQLSRNIQDVARKTKVTGNELMDVVKSSEEFATNLKNARNFSTETMEQIIGLSAEAKKMGISEVTNKVIKATNSFSSLMAADDKTKALMFSAAGSVGKTQELLDGKMMSSKENLKSLSLGLGNVMRNLGYSVEDLDGLSDTQRELLNDRMKRAYGLELGEFEKLIDATSKMSRTMTESISDIDNSLQKTNLTAEEVSKLEKERAGLLKNASFKFLTDFDTQGKKSESFSEAASKAGKKIQESPERFQDLQAIAKEMNMSINTNADMFKVSALSAAKELKLQSGGEVDFTQKVKDAFASNDLVQVRELITEMNAKDQSLGAEMASKVDPFTDLSRRIVLLNDSIRQLTGKIGGGIVDFVGASGLLAMGIASLAASVVISVNALVTGLTKVFPGLVQMIANLPSRIGGIGGIPPIGPFGGGGRGGPKSPIGGPKSPMGDISGPMGDISGPMGQSARKTSIIRTSSSFEKAGGAMGDAALRTREANLKSPTEKFGNKVTKSVKNIRLPWEKPLEQMSGPMGDMAKKTRQAQQSAKIGTIKSKTSDLMNLTKSKTSDLMNSAKSKTSDLINTTYKKSNTNLINYTNRGLDNMKKYYKVSIDNISDFKSTLRSRIWTQITKSLYSGFRLVRRAIKGIGSSYVGLWANVLKIAKESPRMISKSIGFVAESFKNVFRGSGTTIGKTLKKGKDKSKLLTAGNLARGARNVGGEAWKGTKGLSRAMLKPWTLIGTAGKVGSKVGGKVAGKMGIKATLGAATGGVATALFAAVEGAMGAWKGYVDTPKVFSNALKNADGSMREATVGMKFASTYAGFFTGALDSITFGLLGLIGIKEPLQNILSWIVYTPLSIIENLWSGIKEGFMAGWNMIKPAIDQLWDAFGEIGGVFNNLLSSIGKMFGIVDIDKASGVLEKISKIFMSVWDVIGPFAKSFGYIIGKGIALSIQYVIPWLRLFINLIVDVARIVTGAVQVIAGIVGIVWNSLYGLYGLVYGLFTGDWDIASAALDGLINSMKGIWEGFGNILWGGLRGVFDLLLGPIVAYGAMLVAPFYDIFTPIYDTINGVKDWFYNLYMYLVGNSIVPDLVNGIIDWFSKLPIIIFSLVGKVIGAFAMLPIKIVGKLVEMGTSILDYIGNLGNNIGGPIGAIIQSIFEPIKTISEMIKNVFGGVQEYFGGIFKIIQGVFSFDWSMIKEGFKQSLSGLGDILWGLLKGAFDLISAPFTNLFNNIVNSITFVKDLFLSIPGKLIDSFMSLPGQLYEGFKNAVTDLLDWVMSYLPGGETISKVTQGFSETNQAASERRSKEGDSVIQGSGRVVGGIADVFTGGGEGRLAGAKKAVSGGLETGLAVVNAVNPLSYFDSGSKEIQQTGMAVVHQGEMILPKNMFDLIKAKGLPFDSTTNKETSNLTSNSNAKEIINKLSSSTSQISDIKTRKNETIPSYMPRDLGKDKINSSNVPMQRVVSSNLDTMSNVDNTNKTQVHTRPIHDIDDTILQKKRGEKEGAKTFKSAQLVAIEKSSMEQVELLVSIRNEISSLASYMKPTGSSSVISSESNSNNVNSTKDKRRPMHSPQYGNLKYGKASGNANKNIINDGE